MEDSLEDWCAKIGIGDYASTIVDQAEDLGTLATLTVSDVKEIASIAKMTVSRKRKFLTAHAALVSGEKKKPKHSSIPPLKTKGETEERSATWGGSSRGGGGDATIISANMTSATRNDISLLARNISVRFNEKGLACLKFLKKLVVALRNRPKERLKISRDRFDDGIGRFGPASVDLLRLAGFLLRRDDDEENVYLSILDPSIDDRSALPLPPVSSIANLNDAEAALCEEIGKLTLVAGVYEEHASGVCSAMREANEELRETYREQIEEMNSRIEAYKTTAMKHAQRVREARLVPPHSNEAFVQLRPPQVDPDSPPTTEERRNALRRLESRDTTTSRTFSTPESRALSDIRQRVSDSVGKTYMVQYELPEGWKLRARFGTFERVREIYAWFSAWLRDRIGTSDENLGRVRLEPRGGASREAAAYFGSGTADAEKRNITFFDAKLRARRLRFSVRLDDSDDETAGQVLLALIRRGACESR